MKITDAAFDRVVTHLAGALGELDVPEPTIERIAGALAPLRPEVVEVPAAREPQTGGSTRRASEASRP